MAHREKARKGRGGGKRTEKPDREKVGREKGRRGLFCCTLTLPPAFSHSVLGTTSTAFESILNARAR
jgi:hypothetical protein